MRDGSARSIPREVMTYLPEHSIPLLAITNALAFSPDGALLALATRDKHAHNLMYRVGDWSPQPAPRFARYDLRFGTDGALVVAGVGVERFIPNPTKLAKSAFSIPGHPKGITRLEVSPDGRWIAVHKYLDRLELWFVGVSPPEQRCSVWTGSAQLFFFAADSARFFHSSHGYEAGRSVDALHQIALHADGRTQGPTDGPLPDGLSAHNVVCATPHGLVTLGFPERDVVVCDWDALRPRRLGVRSLEGAAAVAGFAVSSDGCHVVVQVGVDRDDRPREWKLVVVALPTGEEVGELPIGTISAGHLALSKRAERIAFTRSDTDREVRVFRRDA